MRKEAAKKKKRGIARKLILAFCAVSACSAAVAAIGSHGMARANSAAEESMRVAERLPAAAHAMTCLSHMESSARDAVINFHNSELFESDKASIDKSRKDYQSYEAELLRSAGSPEASKELTEAAEQFRKAFDPKITDAIKAADSSQLAQADTLLQNSIAPEETILQHYQNFMDLQNRASAGAAAEEKRVSFFLFLLQGVFSLCAIAASLWFGIRFSRSIGRPLGSIAEAARKFSNGSLDLRISYAGSDEIGDLADSLNASFRRLQDYVSETAAILLNLSEGDFTEADIPDFPGNFAPLSASINSIREKLSASFSQIGSSADQIGAGAAQVSEGAQQVARGAEKQSRSVDQLTVSVNGILEKSRENADDVARILKDTGAALESVEESDQQMKRLLALMEEIRASSEKMRQILAQIDSIAFQTNLLALNASVEAARVGSAGHGFTVVAQEVRALAEKTAAAAKQTDILIEDSVQKIGNGCERAEKTASELTKTAGKFAEINESIGRITSASEDQANSAEQAALSAEQVGAVIRTNADLSSRSAAAGEELSGHAELLRKLLAQVRLQGEPGTRDQGKIFS
ncbi:HAMP domain-containing protein [Caproiciproducens sp. NJN-50]|uniref:methyl-accepting chemotaxis protein n=1 Tax=Caproiciproducens sp. NJN-50 TaxID=2507162 RepID=UPI000FFE09C7|nr:methyl-accepting chemotaxis protein [Caproiciproducens sp. NJN-50]QAT50493.1 HAMP domain-containing protein [Caproiciproducens sp. NJN-50]